MDDLAQEGWIAMWRHLPNLDKYDVPVDFQLKQAAQRRMWVVLDTLNREGGSDRGKRTVNTASSVILTDWSASEWEELALGQADIDLIYHSGQIAHAFNVLSVEEREYIWLQFYMYRGPRGRNIVNPLVQERWKPVKAKALWRQARKKLAIELDHLRGCYD